MDKKKTNNRSKITTIKKKSSPSKVVTEKEFEIIKAKKRNDKVTKFFASIIFVIFIFYLGGYFFGLLNRKTTGSTTVIYGNVDLIEPIDGVIVRDEIVFKTEKSGQITYYANDLEKVRVGTIVATVQNENDISDIKKEIEKIDNDIWKLQEQRGDYSLAKKEAKKIDEQVKEYINNNIFEFSSTNIENVYSMKDEIDNKVNRRNQLLLEEDMNSLKNLSDERSLVINDLNKNSYNMRTDKSGIISYNVDGFEEVFTVNDVSSIKKEQIKNSSKNDFISTKKDVQINDPVFKLINSNTWYIGAYINNSKIDKLKEDDNKTLYIIDGKNFKKISSKVKKIVPYTKESYVVFEMRKNLLDFIDKRYVTLNLSESEENGLKIPKSSVAEFDLLKVPSNYIFGDEFSFVMKKTDDENFIKVPVKIYSSEKDFSWVVQKFEFIKYGDTIYDPNNNEISLTIQDSIKIYGVYKINSSIAKFTQIMIDSLPLDSDSYIVIDPNLNRSLKNYDIIVTDSTNIEDGQRIYR